MGSLPAERQFGLELNLRRVQAQDRLHRSDYEPTDYESVYALYLQAYDNEDLAQRAASQAAELFVKQECEMARHAQQNKT